MSERFYINTSIDGHPIRTISRRREVSKAINLNKFSEALSEEMLEKQKECQHAARMGWYDKAAKLANEIEGLRKARFLANSGDFHVKAGS